MRRNVRSTTITRMVRCGSSRTTLAIRMLITSRIQSTGRVRMYPLPSRRSGFREMRTATIIAAAMEGVPDDIKQRQLVHFYRADPAYGIGVAAKLGLPIPEDD
jgi:hypothetical protein